MSFARFMELALYHSEVGYYRREKTRVGRGTGTDFYTATSAGTVFGELVAAACTKLIAPRSPTQFTFVEVGAEPGSSVLQGVAHPFREVRTLRLGDPLEIPESSIVFSNELFDAQPVHRVVSRDGSWRELGVVVDSNALAEVELPEISPEVQAASVLPAPSSIGRYHLDLPLAATQLARRLAEGSWSGLFVAFDYGKSWAALSEETPGGTARAYWQHHQSNELLARPGQQDLTCHVCWDWIADALTSRGFATPKLFSQEQFLLRFAADAASAIATAEAKVPASPRKSNLHQLLHPALQGQKFQVLVASRA